MNRKRKVILIAVAFLSFSISIFAQNFSLKMDNVSVRQAINELKDKSGYSFVFASEDFNTRKTVSVDAKNIDTAVKQIIAGQNVSYEIKGRNVIIKKAIKPDAVNREKSSASDDKTESVSGIIKDSKGVSVTGASVVVAGTTVGTYSDNEGKFSLNVPYGCEIEISFLGSVTRRIPFDGSKNYFDITLEDDRKVLDEAVVIGYGTTTRKNLTTAIATIKPENISKAAVSNVSSLLLGRAAGLQATVSSTQPDGYVAVSIRGAGTPIYVIDGVVMPAGSLEPGSGSSKLPSSISRSGIGGLNPDDIESIEVLKDASAAIYGIGASNGVILITTKRGKAGKPIVTYSGSYSITTNQRTIKVLNSEQYMRVANAFSKEQYYYNHGVYPYGTNTYDGGWSPVYNESTIQSNTIDTDWTDLVLRKGNINNQNVTVRGGSDKVQYYLGLNYYGQDATVRNSDMSRYVIHTNVTASLFPFMKLTTTLNYNNNKYTNSTVGSDSAGGHTYGAYQAAISYPPLMAEKENGEYTLFSSIPNPKALETIEDNTEKNTIYTNLTLDTDIIKNMLSIKGVYGVNKEWVERSLYIPSNVYYNQMYRSRGNIGDNNRTYQTYEITANFHKNFADIVDVELMAGMGKYLTDYYSHSLYYEDADDHIGDDDISLAQGSLSPTSTRTSSEKRSQFIRGTFNFLDRYVLSATLRRDGTDKFFPSKKYSLFPSVSVAWKISEENFMKNVHFINLLKLRVSYGQTGLDNLGTSLYGIYTPSSTNVKFDNGSSMYTPYILSGDDYDDVSWERTTMKNIGLDFSVWKNRIWGSLEVYRNDETDLLAYANASWLSMFSTRPINSGHYKREGIELNLNAKVLSNKNFEWTTTLNLSHNQNLWVERVDNYDYQIYQKHKNEPVDYYYYYKKVGIINSDKSNMPNSQKSLSTKWQQPGCAIIDDKNGDGTINQEDIYLDNDGDPKMYFGFGNTFTYKNFDLDIYIYGRAGIRKWNRGLGYGSYSNLLTLSRNVGVAVYDQYNSITNPYGTRTGYAASQATTLPGGVGVDLDVQDASFLRVRNITLGYNFKLDKISFLRNYISNVRVYCDVQNPFLLTNYDMVDPEISTGGGQSSYVNYPQTRTYSFGLKVTF